MRKNKLDLLSMIMAAICTFSGACKNENDDAVDVGEISRYTVYGFEGKYFGIGACEGFGKVAVNHAAQFVKSGERSLQLIPSMEHYYPYVYLPFDSKNLNESKTNLLRITDVTLEIYATQATTIGLGLYYSERAEDISVAKTYSLSEGWNTVVYENIISFTELSINMEKFLGIYLAYEENDNRPTIYVDDVSIGETKKDIPYRSLVTLDLKNDYAEIANFEHSYQNIIFSTKNSGAVKAPEFSIVKAVDFNLTAPSGERILRIKPSVKTDGATSFSFVNFSANFLRIVPWSDFLADADAYELDFEVYIAGEREDEARFSLGVETMDLMGYGLATATGLNEWKHCSVPLSALVTFMENPSGLRFYFKDGIDENRTFFVDDIRIVPKSEQGGR